MINPLRLFVVAAVLLMSSYCYLVVQSQGSDFISPFTDSIMGLTWQGAFNIDFMCYLLLTSFWIAWRHRWSLLGVFFGFVNCIGGIVFFGLYLLLVSIQTQGDIFRLLVGQQKHTQTSVK